MQLQNWLYYQKAKGDSFTETATGDLDITRMLDGKTDCWRKPELKLVLQPKRLILNDWTAPSWSFRQIEQVQKKLKALLDDGFAISRWDGVSFVELKESDLSSLESAWIRKEMIPIDSASVRQLFCDKHRELAIDFEQTQCLDSYHLNLLLANEAGEEFDRLYEIDLYEIIQSYDDIAKMISVLTTAKPQPTKIHANVNHKHSSYVLAEMIKAFPGIIIDYSIQHVLGNERGTERFKDLNGNDINPGIYKSWEIEAISDDELSKFKSLTEDNEQYLERLSINEMGAANQETITWLMPAELLEKFFNVSELTLKMTNHQFSREIYKNILKGVSSLTIESSDGLRLSDRVQLDSPVKYCQCLKELHISGVELISESDDVHLEHLHIINVGCDYSLQLFKKAKNIEEFDLDVKFSGDEEINHFCAGESEWGRSIKRIHIGFDGDVDFAIAIIRNFQINLDLLSMISEDDADKWYELLGLVQDVRKLSLDNQYISRKDKTRSELLFSNLKKMTLNHGSYLGLFEYFNVRAPHCEHFEIIHFDATIIGCLTELHGFSSGLNHLVLGGELGDEDEDEHDEMPISDTQISTIDLSFLEFGSISVCLIERFLRQFDNLATIILDEGDESINNELVAICQRIGKSNIVIEMKKTFRAREALMDETVGPRDLYEILDADTSFDTDEGYEINRIFLPPRGGKSTIPHPAMYRLKTFDLVGVNKNICEANLAFSLNNSRIRLIGRDDFNWANHDLYETAAIRETEYQITDNSVECFYARTRLRLSNTPVPLPSLSANEKITDIHSDFFRPDQVKIQYSERDNMYYISTQHMDLMGSEVEIDYIVAVPRFTPNQECDVTFFRNFGIGKLEESDGKHERTGNDWAELIYHQKKGACRHRALIFMLLSKKNQIKARYVDNESHAFVEIQQKDKDGRLGWCTYDLGGYPAHTNINELAPPLNNKRMMSNKIDFDGPSSALHAPLIEDEDKTDDSIKKILTTWEDVSADETNPIQFIQHILNAHGKNSLVVFDEEKSNEYFKNLVEEHCHNVSTHVIVIDEPDELRLSVNTVNIGNEYTEAPGLYNATLSSNVPSRLSLMIDSAKSAQTHLIIVIDFTKFTPKEIVSANFILDRTKESLISVSDKITIIALQNIASPHAYMGSDFTSRFQQRITNPFTSRYLLSKSRTLLTPLAAADELKCSIDCYGMNWREQIIGLILPAGHDLFFKPGQLVIALNSEPRPTCIELINPPDNDPEFERFMRELLLWRKLRVCDQIIDIPTDLRIYHSTRHSVGFSDLIQHEMKSEVFNDCYILNPTTLGRFFREYATEGGRLIAQPGLIEQHTKRTLRVFLTSDITEDSKARFFTECEHHEVRCDIFSAPDINLLFDDYAEDDNTFIIDVTDYKPKDLFSGILAYKDPSSQVICFSSQIGIVNDLLDKGHTVVLKGKLTPEMQDKIYSISFGTERIKNRHLILQPETLTENPALNNLPNESLYMKEAGNDFSTARKMLIDNALSCSPYLVIYGATGVGKTTTILGLKSNDRPIFVGENQLGDWLYNGGILFIDEANMTNSNWRIFPDPNAKNPGIVFNHQFIRLDDRHKVIFAANPSSYGGDRHEPSLFSKNYVQRIEFTTFPIDYLRDEILIPIFAKNSRINETIYRTVCEKFLGVYQQLLSHSRSEVLITARELEMMALLFIVNWEVSKDPDEVAQYCIDSVRASILNQKWVPNDLNVSFANDFVATESRYSAIHALSNLLAIRNLKMSLEGTTTTLPGGLGGLLLEGEPGVGKSQLVYGMLQAKGLAKNRDFYHLQANMTNSAKHNLLLKAFNEGAIVIIDEINSASLSERLLNDLLMGVYEGKKPERPGFMMIGTQNPASSMSGRQQISNALKRRLFSVTLPEYTMAEMIDIAKQRGLARVDAENIVDIYFERIRFAKLHRLEPLPNFRTFNDAMNCVLQIYSRAAHAINHRDDGVLFEANFIDTEKNSADNDFDSWCTEEFLDSSSFIVPDKSIFEKSKDCSEEPRLNHACNYLEEFLNIKRSSCDHSRPLRNLDDSILILTVELVQLILRKSDHKSFSADLALTVSILEKTISKDDFEYALKCRDLEFTPGFNLLKPFNTPVENDLLLKLNTLRDIPMSPDHKKMKR